MFNVRFFRKTSFQKSLLGSRKSVSILLSLKRTIGQTIDFEFEIEMENWYQVDNKI